MSRSARIALNELPVFPALERIWAVLPEARLVGGAVRDLLRGADVADFDLAVPEPPEEVVSRLGAAGLKVVPTGLSHGTVTAVIDGRGFEITTLRRDEQTDGRHAQVVWTTDWEEDAARRDFTINAMSCDRTGQVHDYFGGQDDLAQARVRFVGAPRERIHEDALRILRFFRFQGRFGKPAPDAETLEALRDGAPLIRRLSVERIWSELRRILVAPGASAMLALMAELGVLRECVPQLAGREADAVSRLQALVACNAPELDWLRFAALLAGGRLSAEQIEESVRHLRLSRVEADLIAHVLALPMPEPTNANEEDIARFLADTPRNVLVGGTWLAQSAAREAGKVEQDAAWNALRKQLNTMPVPVFPLAGRDLVRRGMSPGPAIGEMMARVRMWWLEGGCRASRETCLEVASRFLKETGES